MQISPSPIPEGCPDEGGDRIAPTGVAALIAALDDEVRAEIEAALAAGNVRQALSWLELSGLTPTAQLRVLRSMQRAAEGPSVIAWTKDRLVGFIDVLCWVLRDSADNAITSDRNILRAYEAFRRIFADQGLSIRLGQFEYVLRRIFAGVRSEDEVVDRILAHATFGEWSREELRKEISAREVFAQVDAEWDDAAGALGALRATLTQAADEDRGLRDPSFGMTNGEHRDYRFARYRFHEDSDWAEAGGDSARSMRSSWEAMVFAAADAMNAQAEQKLGPEAAAEVRLELVYEAIPFPVDIVTGADGRERYEVYHMDFLELRRLRAFEVKGALDDVAREKIRKFRKLYVEQDFQDLSATHRLPMMDAVRRALREVGRLRAERGMDPDVERIERFDVLGGFPWDWDIVDFARRPKEERTFHDLGAMQKFEHAMQRGRLPDVRPEAFIPGADTDKLLQRVGKEARRAGRKIRKPAAVPKFDAGAIGREFAELRERGPVFADEHRTADILEDFMNERILPTIPGDAREHERVNRIERLGVEHNILVHALAQSGDQATARDLELVVAGKAILELSFTNSVHWDGFCDRLQEFIEFLEREASRFSSAEERFRPQRVVPILRSSLKHMRARMQQKGEGWVYRVDAESIRRNHQSTPEERNVIIDTLTYYGQLLLGEYKSLYIQRYNAVSRAVERLKPMRNNHEEAMAGLRTSLKRSMSINAMTCYRYCDMFAEHFLLQEDLSRDLTPLLSLSTFLMQFDAAPAPNETCRSASYIASRPEVLSKALQLLASQDASFTRERALELLMSMHRMADMVSQRETQRTLRSQRKQVAMLVSAVVQAETSEDVMARYMERIQQEFPSEWHGKVVDDLDVGVPPTASL